MSRVAFMLTVGGVKWIALSFVHVIDMSTAAVVHVRLRGAEFQYRANRLRMQQGGPLQLSYADSASSANHAWSENPDKKNE